MTFTLPGDNSQSPGREEQSPKPPRPPTRLHNLELCTLARRSARGTYRQTSEQPRLGTSIAAQRRHRVLKLQ
ncbi:hypothetical protein KC349_g90 [Hortaea werneckii]|nr:hypothetical protein KC349_g90 [Hortaea werneckii]